MPGRPAAWIPVPLSDLGQALPASGPRFLPVHDGRRDPAALAVVLPAVKQPPACPSQRQRGPRGEGGAAPGLQPEALNCRHRGQRVSPLRRLGRRGYLWLLGSFLNVIAFLRDRRFRKHSG